MRTDRARAQAVSEKEEKEKARAQAVEEKEEKEKARALEAEQRLRTDREAQDKEKARALAADNFRKAREVVHRFPERMSKEVLLNEPGLQRVRRDLAREARTAFEGFVADQGDHPEPEVQADLARAWMLEADITNEINPNHTEAVDLINRAIAIFETLTRSDKISISYQRELATCYNKRGTYYYSANHRALAEASFRKGLELFDAIVKGNPRGPGGT